MQENSFLKWRKWSLPWKLLQSLKIYGLIQPYKSILVSQACNSLEVAMNMWNLGPSASRPNIPHWLIYRCGHSFRIHKIANRWCCHPVNLTLPRVQAKMHTSDCALKHDAVCAVHYQNNSIDLCKCTYWYVGRYVGSDWEFDMHAHSVTNKHHYSEHYAIMNINCPLAPN